MESMKVLKMHLSIQMDDLKDAEMLEEYAIEAKEHGEEALSQKLIAKAKIRLQSFENCENEIQNYMSKIKAEDPEADAERILHEAYKDYFEEQKNRIKSKIMAM